MFWTGFAGFDSQNLGDRFAIKAASQAGCVDKDRELI